VRERKVLVGRITLHDAYERVRAKEQAAPRTQSAE